MLKNKKIKAKRESIMRKRKELEDETVSPEIRKKIEKLQPTGKPQISETEAYRNLVHGIIFQAIEDVKFNGNEEETEKIKNKKEALEFINGDTLGSLIYLISGNDVNPSKIRKLIIEEIVEDSNL